MHYPADRVKMNHHAVYLGQSEVILRESYCPERQTDTHTHTHTHSGMVLYLGH